MDQETAYNVMMGWASKARVKAWMQKVTDGSWDVTVQITGHRERTFSERSQAVAYWKQAKAEKLIPQ